jgi:hypothetical protein
VEALQNLPFDTEGCGDLSFYGLEVNTCNWAWSWTFSRPGSIELHLASFVAYALSVKAVELYVASQKQPYKAGRWLETVKWWHNITLSLVSLLMFGLILNAAIGTDRFSSIDSMQCKVTPMVGWYGLAQFLYLATKIWEWADTYFLVLSGKPVIWLHYFHHMTTFTMAAVVQNMPSGTFSMINCLVHFVMYLHYAHPIRIARPFITCGQLLQFIIVMSINWRGFHSYLFEPAGQSTCHDITPVFWEDVYCQTVVFVYFIMFMHFFYDQYMRKKPRLKVSSSVEAMAPPSIPLQKIKKNI